MTPNVYLRIDNGIIRREVRQMVGRGGTPHRQTARPYRSGAPKSSLPSTTALLPEATYTNEDIYPSHVGKVSEVFRWAKPYDITDRDNTIDYGNYQLPDEPMRIVFQSEQPRRARV